MLGPHLTEGRLNDERKSLFAFGQKALLSGDRAASVPRDSLNSNPYHLICISLKKYIFSVEVDALNSLSTSVIVCFESASGERICGQARLKTVSEGA